MAAAAGGEEVGGQKGEGGEVAEGAGEVCCRVGEG